MTAKGETREQSRHYNTMERVYLQMSFSPAVTLTDIHGRILHISQGNSLSYVCTTTSVQILGLRIYIGICIGIFALH